MKRSLFRIDLLEAQIITRRIKVVERWTRPFLVLLGVDALQAVDVFTKFLQFLLELAFGLAGADEVAFCIRRGRFQRGSIELTLLCGLRRDGDVAASACSFGQNPLHWGCKACGRHSCGLWSAAACIWGWALAGLLKERCGACLVARASR